MRGLSRAQVIDPTPAAADDAASALRVPLLSPPFGRVVLDWLQLCQVAPHGGAGQLTNTLTLTSRGRYDCAARARAIGRAVGLPLDVADVEPALG